MCFKRTTNAFQRYKMQSKRCSYGRDRVDARRYTRQPRLDIAHCTDVPVSLVFLPAADIAAYVGEGNVDLGITGPKAALRIGLSRRLGHTAEWRRRRGEDAETGRGALEAATPVRAKPRATTIRPELRRTRPAAAPRRRTRIAAKMGRGDAG